VTGCEEVGVGHDVKTRNGDGRRVNGELVMGTSSEPPSNLSADDNGSVGNVRKASMFALAARL